MKFVAKYNVWIPTKLYASACITLKEYPICGPTPHFHTYLPRFMLLACCNTLSCNAGILSICFLPTILRAAFASANVKPQMSSSINIRINCSCEGGTPYDSKKYLSNTACSALVNPALSISSYHRLMLFLNLTYLSNGVSSPFSAVINRIKPFVSAISVGVFGLTFFAPCVPTAESNWKQSITLPFANASQILGSSIGRTSGCKYLS